MEKHSKNHICDVFNLMHRKQVHRKRKKGNCQQFNSAITMKARVIAFSTFGITSELFFSISILSYTVQKF